MIRCQQSECIMCLYEMLNCRKKITVWIYEMMKQRNAGFPPPPNLKSKCHNTEKL